MEIPIPTELPAAGGGLPPTRGYQQEMLEESLINNLIIALDTGSGKTHIAVLRMKIEAEHEPKKVKHILTANAIQNNILVGLLVLCTHCGVMRSAKLSDITSPSGISWADLWCP